MGKQNKKLIKNLEKYEEEKAKQQESKIHGQKPVKQQGRKEKSVSMYNS
tara:strand:- start:705 stop:851 length:147 start_codon:yes stop_codon:yes gene_type:complete